MLDEKAVKEFFLETSRWIVKENPTPILNSHFPHSCALLHDNGCLHYIDVWSEVETKNIVQSIGHILIWHQEGPLWGINYDGWYERDRKIRALEKELLIKALPADEFFRCHNIYGATEDGCLLHESIIKGRFQTFEIETLIVPSDQRSQPVSRFTYSGRALVNLSA